MNYLTHFVYNHTISGLPRSPEFVLGVALPDLWLRFSRNRRIRWRAVRAATPTDAPAARLRAGLLNHVAADERFHALPAFLHWQRQARQAVAGVEASAALVDFLAHASVELALDYHLMRRQPRLVEDFYDVVAANDVEWAAACVGELGAVDTTGLAEVLRQFVTRRFLRTYSTLAGLSTALRLVLSLAAIPLPADGLIEGMVAAAAELADPAIIWEELGPLEPDEGGAPPSASAAGS